MVRADRYKKGSSKSVIEGFGEYIEEQELAEILEDEAELQAERERRRTEAGMRELAKSIYEVINANWKLRKEWLSSGVKNWNFKIEESEVVMRYSDDGLAIYLWLMIPWEDEPRLKVIPACGYLSKEYIYRLLESQPWAFI